MMTPDAIGAPMARTEGPDKVTGRARYSAEHELDGLTYGWIVASSVAAGTITGIDDTDALAVPGVMAVITHQNAETLHEGSDTELQVLQSRAVSYRGQIVALVVATTLEAAREGAAALRVDYDERDHDVVLRTDDPDLYAPEQVNAGFATDSSVGDLEAALAEADVVLDQTYSTPALHNNPMEPHATTARWDGDHLDVWDSTQAPSGVATSLRTAFGLDAEQVRVTATHVGGGFGSKGTARPNVVLAALAARHVDRPVKVVLTRPMMFLPRRLPNTDHPTHPSRRPSRRHPHRLGARDGGAVVSGAGVRRTDR